MLDSLMYSYDVFNKMSDIWWSRQLGTSWINKINHIRLESLIKYAYEHSNYYHHLYRDIPRTGFSIEDIPIVKKQDLMQSFNDWVTDRSVNEKNINEFVDNLGLVGKLFQNRFAVWKSSGSTGEPGIYVHDKEALAVYDALIGVQLNNFNMLTRCMDGFLYSNKRLALIVATGSHFASISSWQRITADYPCIDNECFSIMTPISELVDMLNEYQPDFIASYPTMLTQLADLKRKGILKIKPKLVWSGGELLTHANCCHIEKHLKCRVINEYGASEFFSIGFSCEHGRLHINSDWVILEAVDKDYRPVMPGDLSATTLLTNLANRIQPMIRYDLGDRITYIPDICPCGSPLPSIVVEGRKNDVLRLLMPNNQTIELLPLTISTVLEENAGIHCFQIIQTGTRNLSLRIDKSDDDKKFFFEKARSALEKFLISQGLKDIQINIDNRKPAVDFSSGKLKEVIGMSN